MVFWRSLSNPRVAGSIPAAPTILLCSLRVIPTKSYCKFTASWEELDSKLVPLVYLIVNAREVLFRSQIIVSM